MFLDYFPNIPLKKTQIDCAQMHKNCTTYFWEMLMQTSVVIKEF